MTSLEFNKNQILLKDSKLFMNLLAGNLKNLMGIDIAMENPQMGEFPIKRIVDEFFETSLVVSVTDSNGRTGLLVANKESLEAMSSNGDGNAVRMLFNTALLNAANSAQPIGGIVEIGEEEESKAYWSTQDMELLVVAYEVKANGAGQILLAFPSQCFQPESMMENGAFVMDQGSPMDNPYYQQQEAPTGPQVNVSNLKLPDLDEGVHTTQSQALNYIDDIPMQITVEVGRSRMSVREILGINKGSIIPLDRMADDPVDVLVNGKLFAKGEIVVIDDFFGVRLVEIIQNSNFKMANKNQL